MTTSTMNQKKGPGIHPLGGGPQMKSKALRKSWSSLRRIGKPPVIARRTPRYSIRAPNVMMNEWMPSRVTRKPFRAPIASPAASVITSAAGAGTPMFSNVSAIPDATP